MEQVPGTASGGSKTPLTTSSNAEERKLARQLRIRKRNDAARRGTQEGEVPEEIVVGKTQLEKQVEQSAEELERLLLEGRELVTNVRVASDTREVSRRQEEVVNLKKRLERLEEEENASKELFEEVNKKWESMSQHSDPMDLKAEIDAQREKCHELLEQKNAVIQDLMSELEAADLRFVNDQQRQLKEVSLLVQRIENQVKVMKEAYRRELQLIEDAISDERKELLDSCNQHWDSLYKQRDKEEVNTLSIRFKEVEDQEQEIQRVRTEHQERYRQTKIKLDTDIEVMTHEMEQVKALCLLNSEKLDYNYQVLQKREAENVMMRAQQKRRINKLQDVANNLRRKIRDTEASANQEMARLKDEISRLNRNVTDIERKADHFADINDRRYHQVWDLHQATANKLVSRIMTIDRIIHEQQLGLEWSPPDFVLLQKTDLPSFQTAMQLVNKLFEPKGESSVKGENKKKNQDNYAVNISSPEDGYDDEEGPVVKMQSKLIPGGYSSSDVDEPVKKCETTQAGQDGDEKEAELELKQTARLRLLKLVLQRVADNAGFLVEERLQDILAPYSHPQQTIVKLDNVFNALGLQYEADIEMLKDFFLPYAVCTVCSKPNPLNAQVTESDDGQKVLEIFNPEQGSEVSQPVMALERSSSGSVATSSTEIQTGEPAVVPLPSSAVLLPPQPCPPEKSCCESHDLEIDSVYVLQALRNFVSKFQENQLVDLKSIAFMLSQKRTTVSRLLTVEDVTKFWDCYKTVFPSERERLWDGFLIALNKYHKILSERHKLNNEAKALKRQNADLRRLLNSYLKSDHQSNENPVQNGRSTLPPLARGKNQ